MKNLLMFSLFCYISLTILSFNLEGESGLATTTITTAIDNDDTTLMVHSTAGFLRSDVLSVDGENICYSGTTTTSFTGLTRGCRDTGTSSHSVDTRVYNEATGFINQVVGFNLVSAFVDDGFFKGLWKMVRFGPGALKNMITKLVMWDYSFLEGNGVYIKYLICYPISLGVGVSFIQLIRGR